MSLFKKLFATATVDGITFYSYRGFRNYLADKEQKRKIQIKKENGYNEYHIYGLLRNEIARVICLLESQDIFDYDIHYYDEYEATLTYYAKEQKIIIKK